MNFTVDFTFEEMDLLRQCVDFTIGHPAFRSRAKSEELAHLMDKLCDVFPYFTTSNICFD